MSLYKSIEKIDIFLYTQFFGIYVLLKKKMENVINQVPSNWSKDLIIRFLYIKLALYFQRYLLYFLANKEEKERQYKKGFINRFLYIVCSNFSRFLCGFI